MSAQLQTARMDRCCGTHIVQKRLRSICQCTSQHTPSVQPSRRDVLLSTLLPAVASWSLYQPLAAGASVPEIAAAGQWGLPFSLPAPPEPVRFPRKALNLRFAVLLMRSSFDAVNTLDFIPMDKFEVRLLLKQIQKQSVALVCACRINPPVEGEATVPLCSCVKPLA